MTRVLPLALAARAAWVDESLYHINPLSYDPSKLAQKDTGDLAGDLFFDITTFTNAFACARAAPPTARPALTRLGPPVVGVRPPPARCRVALRPVVFWVVAAPAIT